MTLSETANQCGEQCKALILEKAFHREGRQGREGRQSTNFVIKITNLVIASAFTLALIALASLSVLGGSNAGFRFIKKTISTQRRKVRKESHSLNAKMKITNPVRIVSRYFPLRSSAFFASLRLIAVFGFLQ